MGFHWWDLLFLAGLGLIIFGPKRLPEMGAAVGKTIREFQKSMREVTDPTPPSSVPPGDAPTAQPVTAAPEPTPVIESAPQATVVEEGVTPLVEEDAVR